MRTKSLNSTGVRRALGLMSGTSRDGIDVALLVSDGEAMITTGPALTIPYEEGFRRRLAKAASLARRRGLGAREDLAELEAALTDLHAAAVADILRVARVGADAVDVIGFSGHTLLHRPDKRLTWQMGDAQRLATATGTAVIADFRSRDVAAGGEGAPLAPIYHHARYRTYRDRRNPVAILNLGGVANVTWLDIEKPPEAGIVAFDCGPGNALIDDWVATHTGQPFDADGALAQQGRVDEAVLARLLAHPYFTQVPPKSLDRDTFTTAALGGLSAADGAATLAALTVAAVAAAEGHFPTPVSAWYVSGGGRRNRALMSGLANALAAPVAPVEVLGWDGDALEAELFAYLAVRSSRGLPLSFPRTTGVPRPMTGGIRFEP